MSEVSHLRTTTGKSCLDQPQGPTCFLIWFTNWLVFLALITPTCIFANLVHAPFPNCSASASDACTSSSIATVHRFNSGDGHGQWGKVTLTLICQHEDKLSFYGQ